MTQPNLSIIIPAYKEAGRIERSLEELAHYLKENDLGGTEVLVVVAESPDDTAKLAEGKSILFENFRVVPSGPKAGKGRDVRTGIMEAQGKNKLFMDADLATPLEHIPEVVELLKDNEVVIAVRNLSSSHKGMRRLVSTLGNWLVQTVLLPGIKDTQCGFKGFTETAAAELFGRQTILGWGFDMEILAIARRLKYRIAKIEVPDWSDRPNSTFDGVTGAATRTFFELLTIKWRSISGKYKNKSFVYEPYQP